MTKEEAEALARKREAHKPRTLHAKEWKAVHDPVKGWGVQLVDNILHVEAAKAAKARHDARTAFQAGDMRGFMDAAFEGTMASLRAEIAKSGSEGD